MNSTVRAPRIGVFTKPLDNWTSGSGHHLDELMRHLLDLNERKGRPVDLTFIHYAKSENPIYARVRELIVPRNPFSASRALRKESFDLLHYSPLTVYAPVWGVRAKKTATVHGVEEELYPQGYTFSQRFHARHLLPPYMRMMDGIATVSETSKRYFVEHYGVKPDRVFITTNGFSSDYRVLSGEGKKLPPDSGISKPFILHISRYSMRKNPIAIIRGFARFIGKTGLDYQLVCAGKGWDGEEARSLARGAGIADRYVAPGFISLELAVRLLNNANVFVFPSFAEGFGMPNVEAMACGCPVVTSNIFAIPEVVGDAAAIIDRPDDIDALAAAIARIETDAGYKKALVERGLERIRRYDWDASAQALLDGWMRVLGTDR